jgi:cell wall-associated NlpC family hydrolase
MPLTEDQLQPGDLVFFGSPVHHVGIYVGGGNMIHAPSSGKTDSFAPIHRSGMSATSFGRIV